MPAQNPDVQTFFHEQSNTFTHLVTMKGHDECLVVDPVIDYDAAAMRPGYGPVEEIAGVIRERGLRLTHILETHAHADHITGAQHLKKLCGGEICINEGITDVIETWNTVYNLVDGGAAFTADDFDRLLKYDEEVEAGPFRIHALSTPGHTPDCATYVIGNAAFIGDTLFAPDYGTARCDFPNGGAGLLYDSIQKLLALPDETVLYLCHDYPPEGRDLISSVTVAEQKKSNKHVGGGATKEDFVKMREKRDADLPVPKLLLIALNYNLRAGKTPPPEANARSYVKLPIGFFDKD